MWAVNHDLTGWYCLISRVQGLAGIKKATTKGAWKYSQREQLILIWRGGRDENMEAAGAESKPQPFKLSVFTPGTFHVGSGRFATLIPLGDIGCFRELSPLSDGVSLRFFFFLKPVRLRWETHMSMRKPWCVYFGLQQEKLLWMYTREDMSVNRWQVASAHFLLLSLYANRLCLPGKRHCCLYPGCLYFPQCSQNVWTSTSCWHRSNRIWRPAFLTSGMLISLLIIKVAFLVWKSLKKSATELFKMTKFNFTTWVWLDVYCLARCNR